MFGFGKKRAVAAERDRSAISRFKQGFNCAQAVISAYGGRFGADDKTLLSIASGFGGGMGCMGETCGAVTGAFMVIGMKQGTGNPLDRRAKKRTYALVREFAKRFKSRHDTTLCKELLGIDMSTPLGMRRFREQNPAMTVCPGFVESAIEILQQLLSR